MKAYGYARVSTKGQEDSGLGEDAQRAAITAKYESLLRPGGYEWGGVWFDGAVSASQPFLEREKGAELNRQLKRGDAVLVSKVDRAFRRLHDLLNTLHNWDQRGVRVIFCDMLGKGDVDNASLAGKCILVGLGFAAEVEWWRASERCKDKAIAAKAQGRPSNQVAPFGFRIGGRGSQRILYPYPAQRSFAKQLVAWWETRSLREIAEHLKSLKDAGHDGILTTNHHAVGRWIKAELELQTMEDGEGITGSKDRFVLPNGKVVSLDYFPAQIRERLTAELAN